MPASRDPALPGAVVEAFGMKDRRLIQVSARRAYVARSARMKAGGA
jgi:hypothetical protein